MKVLGYIRVSGKGQVEGDGPERQAEKIQDFCAFQSLEVGGMYRELAVSGTVDGMDRPVFLNLLEDVRQDIGGIVVERMDRLARDLMVQEVILAELRERGLKLFCADQFSLQDMASNAGDPTRVLIRQILGAVAQWEKNVLVLKMRAGRDKVRERTGRCEGPKPYGTFPGEKEIIEEIHSALKFGATCRSIAETLNHMGKLTRMGHPWTRFSVQRVYVTTKG